MLNHYAMPCTMSSYVSSSILGVRKRLELHKIPMDAASSRSFCSAVATDIAASKSLIDCICRLPGADFYLNDLELFRQAYPILGPLIITQICYQYYCRAAESYYDLFCYAISHGLEPEDECISWAMFGSSQAGTACPLRCLREDISAKILNVISADKIRQYYHAIDCIVRLPTTRHLYHTIIVGTFDIFRESIFGTVKGDYTEAVPGGEGVKRYGILFDPIINGLLQKLFCIARDCLWHTNIHDNDHWMKVLQNAHAVLKTGLASTCSK